MASGLFLVRKPLDDLHVDDRIELCKLLLQFLDQCVFAHNVGDDKCWVIPSPLMNTV